MSFLKCVLGWRGEGVCVWRLWVFPVSSRFSTRNGACAARGAKVWEAQLNDPMLFLP